MKIVRANNRTYREGLTLIQRTLVASTKKITYNSKISNLLKSLTT